MLAGLALLVTLSPSASAADNPEVIATGTSVRIAGLGRKDAFWRFREDLVGQVCVVGDPGLVHQSRTFRGDAFYSGALACPDDQSLYFFQVKVEQGDFGSPEPLRAEADAPPPPVPSGPELTVDDPPAPAWPVGMRVSIRDLSAADANASRRATLLRQRCTVVDEPLAPTGGAWVSGALRCDDGLDYFFFQVALDAAGGEATPTPSTAPPTSTPTTAPRTPSRKADGRLQGEPVPAGKMVRVVDVAPADRHHADRASLVGKTCSVVEGPLVPSVDSFYAGRLFCEGGASWQLYQVAVAPL